MPACSRCDDTGFEIRLVSGVERAAPCACRYEGADGRRLTAAKIPKRFSECTLDTFRATEGNNALFLAKSMAKEFVDGFPLETKRGILFLGSPGVGKTHLAVSVLRALVTEKGVSGLFVDYCELLRTIQASWDKDAEFSQAEILNPVREVEVLLLDDLGAMRSTLWVQEIVFHIINSRYNDEKITLLTSNHRDGAAEPGASPGRQKDLQEATLEFQIGTRLRSRLFEMCMTVDIAAEDYRRLLRPSGFMAHS